MPPILPARAPTRGDTTFGALQVDSVEKQAFLGAPVKVTAAAFAQQTSRAVNVGKTDSRSEWSSSPGSPENTLE
jgi:hypothetical protein